MSKRKEVVGRDGLVKAGSVRRHHSGEDLMDWIASPASPLAEDRLARRPSLEADNGLSVNLSVCLYHHWKRK